MRSVGAVSIPAMLPVTLANFHVPLRSDVLITTAVFLQENNKHAGKK